MKKNDPALMTASIMEVLTEVARDAIIMIDPDGKVVYWNKAAEKIFGYTKDEVFNKPLHLLILPERYREAHQAGLQMFAKTGNGNAINKTIELAGLNKAKQEFPIELSLSAAKLDDGWYAIGMVRDISERKVFEKKLQYLATHDDLTGLPNRLEFIERLSNAIKRAERQKKPLAVLYLDLDYFKTTNDNLGHTIGDEVLKQTGDRINYCIREIDAIARIGGDEFTVILESIDNISDITEVTKRILAVVGQPYHLSGKEFKNTISIGISIYPQDSHDAEVLMINADRAMYQAKQAGRNTYCFYKGN